MQPPAPIKRISPYATCLLRRRYGMLGMAPNFLLYFLAPFTMQRRGVLLRGMWQGTWDTGAESGGKVKPKAPTSPGSRFDRSEVQGEAPLIRAESSGGRAGGRRRAGELNRMHKSERKGGAGGSSAAPEPGLIPRRQGHGRTGKSGFLRVSRKTAGEPRKSGD